MISKAKIKYIKSLGQKKYRNNEQVFVAEGPKIVGDLLAKHDPKILVHTEAWNPPCIAKQYDDCEEYIVTGDELRKLSFLQHPQEVLAVFSQTQTKLPTTFAKEIILALDGVQDPGSQTQTKLPTTFAKEIILALDGVQDPGNLGTIIRIADWFGITQIVCSKDTVDVFNPKVVQATMGSIAHISISYVDLFSFLKSVPEDVPIYGTVLDGEDIYTKELSSNGIIIMGNEGKGISDPIKSLITERLFIPNFTDGRDTAESLNVAIATAITCSEFKRRISYER